MKKLTTLAVILLFLASLVPAYAEDDASIDAEAELTLQDEIQADVGATPDKAGYGLKIALEKLRMGLTFDKEKRAELALKLADKRLEEARLMARENKIEAFQRVKEEHARLILKAKQNLEVSGEDEDDFEEHSELEVELSSQENKLDDIENTILIKSKGLTEEQRQKLLSLMEEFKSQNAEIKIKVSENKQEIKTRLRAKGLNETQLEKKHEKLEANLERFANHQLNQSEKMFALASRLIVKAEAEGNVTIKQGTIDLKAKAELKLNEAKIALANKEYRKAVELARESKRLSTLTIASVRGLKKEIIEQREKRIDDAKRLRDEQKQVLQNIKIENKAELKNLKARLKLELDDDEDSDDEDDSE